MGIFSGIFRARDKPRNATNGSGYRFMMGGSTAGKAVTERSAMQMTAVYACVRILSEAIAGLPLHLYQYTEAGGKEKALDHPLYGGFPYGLSWEGFYSGNSLPVNKALLTVFIITGFAEQSGHGVPIIVSEYGRDAFSFDDNMLKVSIRFFYEPDQVTGRKEHERKMLSLTKSQEKIINFVRENPEATQFDIANSTGLGLSSVKKNMRILQEIGLLERSGSKKIGIWVIR